MIDGLSHEGFQRGGLNICNNTGNDVSFTTDGAVESVVARVPTAAAPVQVVAVEAGVRRVAVDCPPKEDVLVFPLLGNEVRIGEQIIKNIGVEDGLAREFLAEFVALNPFALLRWLRYLRAS